MSRKGDTVITVDVPYTNLFPDIGEERTVGEWLAADENEETFATIKKFMVDTGVETDDEKQAPSRQTHNFGLRPKQHDYRNLIALEEVNEHHQACIRAKVNATVGLGFENEKTHEVLDPLCRWSWLETLIRPVHDGENTGDGLLEIVREPSKDGLGKILGIYHCPSTSFFVYVEQDGVTHHYIVNTPRHPMERFAPFGQVQRMRDDGIIRPDEEIGELIHVPFPNPTDPYYGRPDHLSAIGSIEIDRSAKQTELERYDNGGIGAKLLATLGAKLSKPAVAEIRACLGQLAERRRAHRVVFLNIPGGPETKLQGEPLTVPFKDTLTDSASNPITLRIVSAHRTPQSLAGIAVPGKLGNSSDFWGAMQVFQALTIGPRQRLWETRLGATLGNPKLNGGLGLTRNDFKLKKIVDELGGLNPTQNAIDVAGAKAGMADDGTPPKPGSKPGVSRVKKFRPGAILKGMFHFWE